MENSHRRPELLAPAGDFDALRAAVANGADAVYFGLTLFSARAKAVNFTPEELPGVMDYLHRHNVRGYVALNTLIFSDELSRAAELASAAVRASVDAVIVQDLGLARLIHRMAPEMPLHASTQMTLTESRAIEAVRELGIRRVILARELSIVEISELARRTGMELEVFVHGALCISYSGQCLFSKVRQGRSANRGQCAQLCRMPYELLMDGRKVDLGAKKYLLSPRDLCALDAVGELVRAGVAGFKIEGRLKGAEYVASAVQAYRSVIDSAGGEAVSKELRDRLTQSFSRGFCEGYLRGNDFRKLVAGLIPKNRGLLAGKVLRVGSRGVEVSTQPGVTFQPGDGVAFDSRKTHSEAAELGGRIYAVRELPQKDGRPVVELMFAREGFDLSAVEPGNLVYRTDDPRLRRELEKSFARDVVVRRTPLRMTVTAEVGRPLRIAAVDADAVTAEVESALPMDAAQKHPVSLDLLREQLGRLGDTPYELAEVRFADADANPSPTRPVLAPKSVLNELRRRLAESLLQQRTERYRHEIADSDTLETLRAELAEKLSANPAESSAVKLHVLARTAEQVAPAIEYLKNASIGMLYLDLVEPRELADAFAAARAEKISAAAVGPRILRTGEENSLKALLELNPDAVLVRNLGSAGFIRELAPHIPLVADFSFNVVNELSADYLATAGFARVTAAYDLDFEQTMLLSEKLPAGRLEVVAYQHVPLMHMEHCLLASNVLDARDSSRCGRTCRRHSVRLRDFRGSEHVVLSDAFCRSTIYNALAQQGRMGDFVAHHEAGEIISGGGAAHPALPDVRDFRVEFLDESAAQSRTILADMKLSIM